MESPTQLLMTCIGRLPVHGGSDPGKPRFLSSASGLVEAHGRFFVVSDDDLGLAVFARTLDQPGYSLPIWAGRLPEKKEDRKKIKPDLESLTLIESPSGAEGGAILIVPSGSKPNRRLGALLNFESDGTLQGPPQSIDFSLLYAALLIDFPDLNIEGAVVSGSHLKLLQRGNAHPIRNAVINLDLAGVLRHLTAQRSLHPDAIRSIRKVELGMLHGVPLGFTDAASIHPLETWFLAAAEDSGSTYHDGRNMGSVLGRLNHKDELITWTALPTDLKFEGLAMVASAPQPTFYIISDTDDPESPSELYEVTMSAMPHCV